MREGQNKIMGRNHFVMETKGHCLFCLKSSQGNGASGTVREPGGMTMEEGDGDSDMTSSKVLSLQRLSHYLRLNIRKVFQNVINIAPASTFPVLERSELKGVLCAGCGGLVETMSEITLELEVLQMTLDSLLIRLRERMEGVKEADGMMEQFKTEMLASPQTLLQFGIVKQLRKETLRKCSARLREARPRVILKRFEDKMELPQPVTPAPASPQIGEVLEEPPELSETVPVISSVQGSYPAFCGTSSTSLQLVQGLSSENMESMTLTKKRSTLVAPSPSQAARLRLLQDRIGMGDEQSKLPKPSTIIMTTYQSGLPPPPPPVQLTFNCKICNKTFMRMRHKLRHERAVHQGVKYACGLCPVSFTLKCSRKRHRKNVHNKAGQGTFSFRGLQPKLEPLPIPLQSQDFLEDILPGVFPNTASDSSTATVAAPSLIPLSGTSQKPLPRPFQCPLCPNKYTHPSNLRRHRRTVHMEGNGRRLPTTDGSLQFQIGHSERIEVNQDHSDQFPYFIPEEEETGGPAPSQDNPGEDGGNEIGRQHKCQYCGKRYNSIRNLRHHLTVSHFYHCVERKHPCEVCGKTFIRKEHLSLHRRSVHWGQRYSCPLCFKDTFTQLSSMKLHMKSSCPKRAG